MNLAKKVYAFCKSKFNLIYGQLHLALKFHLGYDWLTLDCAETSMAIKSGNLAIFTQTFNEGELLLYWEAYYEKFVGHENLFVLNNGGNDDSCQRLNRKTTVVNMPGGLVDLHNLAQMNGYFQRFLLLKYKWVLKVDVDEFMVCKGGLLEKLELLPDGIYSPERAVAVIHNKDKEAAFNYKKSLFNQRSNYIDEWPALKKPSLTSSPATWTIGNHHVKEKSSVLEGLWMVHLRYMDYERLLERNNRWTRMTPSSLSANSTRAFSEIKVDTKDFTANELDERLAEARVDLPEWVLSSI